MPTTDEILAAGLSPIPGDNPAGVNIRYEAEFQRIDDELRKLESPSGGDVAWAQVLGDCVAITGTRSKDLLVVAYLARTLYQIQRLPGLAIGLQVCRDVLVNFWGNLQPQRVRARRSALDWLSERLSPVLTAADAGSPQGQDALTRCKALIEEIWSWSQGRFEDEDCGLSALRRTLNDLSSGAAPAASSEAAGDAGSGTAAAASPGGRSGPVGNRAEAITRLGEIAEFFNRTEPHSPIGFLIARAVSWSHKSFQEVFVELLKNKHDAQEQVWDSLGIKPPEQNQ